MPLGDIDTSDTHIGGSSKPPQLPVFCIADASCMQRGVHQVPASMLLFSLPPVIAGLIKLDRLRERLFRGVNSDDSLGSPCARTLACF